MNVSRLRTDSLLIPALLTLSWSCGPLDAEEGEFAEADAPAEVAVPIEIPSGSSLEVRLDETLSTRFTRVGARISGSVSEPVVSDGVLLVPEGAKVEGVVTSITSQPPAVSAEFDALHVDGTVYSIRGVVTDQAMVRRSEMKDEAAKIGGGAAAGAVLGGVIGGDVKGAAIGAAAGAAAGTGVAMATKEKWAVLPAGSRLALRLEESLRLARATGENVDRAER